MSDFTIVTGLARRPMDLPNKFASQQRFSRRGLSNLYTHSTIS